MPLKVHFLNVGRGDCTIIEFPSGRIGIVDIDNLKALDPDTERELLSAYREDMNYLFRLAIGQSSWQLEQDFLSRQRAKLTDPLAYYDANIGANTPIWRFIVTHPDMDHMSGLYRLHVQETSKRILNFWHSGAYDFKGDADWSSGLYDERDWDTFCQLASNQDSSVTSLKMKQGSHGSYWTEDGVELWAPTPDLETLAVERGEPNILSMVLKITYKGRSIVLGGDATAEETWPRIYPHIDMSGISVLKAPHHGRQSGYYQPAVTEMAPWLTITSVGQKAYDATDSYRRYSNYTVSLRDAGNVVITVDDDGQWYYSSNVAEHWKPKLTDANSMALGTPN